MNLYALFLASFPEDRSKPFLIHQGGTTSFADLDNLSARYAAVLKAHGVIKGERVVVQVQKSAESVVLYLACLRVGAIYIPLNTAYTLNEVRYFIENATPVLVVCDPQSGAEIAALSADGRMSVLMLDGDGAGSLTALAKNVEAETEIAPCNEDDLAAILYTSGTTGRSKGAMLTHDNLASNAIVLHQYWQFEPDDILLHALPIYHVHGLFVALHCALLNGSTVLFHQRFDVAQIINDLPNATVFMGVPTFYTRLLDSQVFTGELCKNMRLFISGSAPLLAESFRDFETRTGHKILERYGMTEAGMITSNPYDGDRMAGTVGFALPGVSARVADEEGREVARGEVGVLEITGPNVFAGYWQMPEKTRGEFRQDGYFITGDNATMDEEGRIAIVGRAKDMVITGGFNVYPKEVESLIDDLPGVKESAIIGLPHPDFGEGVTAIIVKDSSGECDAETVRSSLQGLLAKFKQPKQFVFMDELPRNAMGKVQKKALREQYSTLYKN